MLLNKSGGLCLWLACLFFLSGTGHAFPNKNNSTIPDESLFATKQQGSNLPGFNVLGLTSGFSKIQPDESIYLYFDNSNELALQDIMALPSNAFILQQQHAPSCGLENQGTLWLKVSLVADHNEEILAELAFPTLRDVSFYALRNDTIVAEYHTGFAHAFGDRPFAANNYVFPLQLSKADVTHIYMQVQADGPLIAPLIFWEKEAHTKNVLYSHSLMALYFGLVIALGLYNLILYFNMQDNTYLYYTLHLVFIGWFQSSMMGYTTMYLWGDSEHYLRYVEPLLLACCAMAVVFQFTRKFLHIDQISKRLDNLLKFLAIGSIGYMALFFILPLKFAIVSMFVCYFGCVLLWMSTAIYAFMKGVRAARYFLVGWSILLAGSVIQNQMYQGMLPYNLFTVQAILFASSIEAILMSIALADRINLMRRDKAEAQQLALEASQQSNSLKDQFLATISHELRTPMNGVLGALELVDYQSLKAEDRHAIQVARLSSRRMLTMINGILNYTEAQLDSTLVNKRTFKIPYDVKDLMDHLQQACASRHLQSTINVYFDHEEAFYGDIEKIRTLILHLTENSLKFTTTGTINMDFWVTDTEQDQKCNLSFRIRDTGVGISQDHQEEIFQAFNQLDGDYNRQRGGLGIGLALVKQLVSILNGDISLQSSPGNGTEFTITLPVERFSDKSANDAPKNLAFIHQQSEPFILIAEDNEVNQKILAALCKKLGYRSIVAINGEAAVTIAKQVSPALIFMDCQMPIMDGFEATRKIRLLNQTMHQVPIVAVTANASSKDQQRCFEVGMNDHITKPISLNSIQSCLLRWLPKQHHHEELVKASQNLP